MRRFLVPLLAVSASCGPAAPPASETPQAGEPRALRVSPTGYSLRVRVEPGAGVAPLHVQLHGELLGGPAFSEEVYCSGWDWYLGGQSRGVRPTCSEPAGGAVVRRIFLQEHVFSEPGEYRVALSLQLNLGEAPARLVSDTLLVRVR